MADVLGAQETHYASTFLTRGSRSKSDSLASLHLKRDLQYPILLRENDENNEGYTEGKVTNTRFGSFPHSTLIGLPWGAQVRASAVDTGSRGRRPQSSAIMAGQKRKRGTEIEDPTSPTVAAHTGQQSTKEALTGFAHLLAPTPESWTTSLPHRTQVVYTPDYSYILQRLRVRPGTVVIEAGAGSGSFTHAAARAVYSGHPGSSPSRFPHGKVFSFEFHDHRVESLREEISLHGLTPIVHIVHRDVYEHGFHIGGAGTAHDDHVTPMQANAIFLDLPAPWLALPHLTRQVSTTPISPLSPKSTARICTFSPCIEQVQRTMISLRAHGWLEIEMVEIAAKRIDVRREHVGLQEEGLRGVNASPASVEESLDKLRQLDKRSQIAQAQAMVRDPNLTLNERALAERRERESAGLFTKQQRLRGIKEAQRERRTYMEGRLVHRTEPEIKTHTSYLVFAVLPRHWDDAEDEAIQNTTDSVEPGNHGKSRRQLKKEARAAREEDGVSALINTLRS